MTDLRERFLKFSKDVIILCKSLELDTVSRPMVSQLVRSATSIGANYAEAQSGISRKDFRSKVYICKKEADETIYWLNLLEECFPDKKDDIQSIMSEAKQIAKILQATTNKLA